MINHNAEGASTETSNLPLATDKDSIAIFIIHEKVQLMKYCKTINVSGYFI